jgi:hypothetical protein
MPHPDKDQIRAELLKCAKAQPIEMCFYGDFATQRLGLPRHPPPGWWKKVLDQIAVEEKQQGRPNITFLLKRKDTGYPGQIGLKKAETPSPQQMAQARDELQRLIDEYSPGSRNPYP